MVGRDGFLGGGRDGGGLGKLKKGLKIEGGVAHAISGKGSL